MTQSYTQKQLLAISTEVNRAAAEAQASLYTASQTACDMRDPFLVADLMTASKKIDRLLRPTHRLLDYRISNEEATRTEAMVDKIADFEAKRQPKGE